eukprot:2056419-Pleurochrysis_carterae.AAC.2
MGERCRGVAARWTDRGFGFIRPEDGGEDLFCHYSSIEDGNALEVDAPVEFVKVYDERKGKERAEQFLREATNSHGSDHQWERSQIQIAPAALSPPASCTDRTTNLRAACMASARRDEFGYFKGWYDSA